MAKERHARSLERSGESLEEARRRHVKQALDYTDRHRRSAPANYARCSNVERAFLNAILRSYLAFRTEYWESDLAHEGNDVPQAYLDSEWDESGQFLYEGNCLFDDLEHVIREWEEELDV